LAIDRSAIDPDEPAYQAGDIQVDHRDPAFQMPLSVVSDGRTLRTLIEGTADGVERLSERQGANVWLQANWEGDVLVLSRRIEFPYGTIELDSLRWRLIEGGRTLQFTHDSKSTQRGTRHTVMMFERR
jgi:hypothetical protein